MYEHLFIYHTNRSYFHNHGLLFIYVKLCIILFYVSLTLLPSTTPTMLLGAAKYSLNTSGLYHVYRKYCRWNPDEE